tara:strand:+ start:164 stop:1243 length:1080 start_codon:yes stop_codon:yes gene_type:complete
MSKARELAELGAVYDSGALSNRNLIINGAMQVAQRGTSTTASTFTAFSSPDCFKFQNNKNSDSVVSQVSDAPDGFNYSLKITVGTGATPSGSDFARLYHRNEGFDAKVFNLGSSSSKAITLSFYVKSSLTGTFGVTFAGDGNGSFVSSYVINSANTWEFKTVSIPAGVWTTYNGSTTNGIGFQVAFDLGEGPDRSSAAGYSASVSSGSMGLTGGTKLIATSSATWQLTGVQLEVGTEATPFEHRSFDDEEQRCLRYYYRMSANGDAVAAGIWYSASQILAYHKYPKRMRAAPTASTSGTDFISTYTSGSSILKGGGVGFDNIKLDSARLNFTTASNGTSGDGTMCQLPNGTYFEMDAEL